MIAMRPPAFLALIVLIGCMTLAGCQPRAAQREHSAPPVEYVVAAGDTLTSIATAYGVSVGAIAKANDLQDHALHPGQRLRIPGGTAPQPVVAATETPSEPAAPAAPATDWYTPRSAWAVEPVILKRTTPMGGTPTRITVHHSGGVKDSTMDALEWLREVDHEHMLGLGKAIPWACIGYHFIIASDGRVFEGRPLEFQGAHAGWDEVNRLNIGICLIGDFDVQHVPVAQRESLLAVLDRLTTTYNISRAEVFGHRHFKVTDCPGRFLAPIVEAYAQGDRPATSTRLATSVPSTHR